MEKHRLSGVQKAVMVGLLMLLDLLAVICFFGVSFFLAWKLRLWRVPFLNGAAFLVFMLPLSVGWLYVQERVANRLWGGRT